MLIEAGFIAGLSTACAFYQPHWGLRLVIHGDDFTFLGTDAALDWAQEFMSTTWDIKIRGRLGPVVQDDNTIRILNRIVAWDDEGITLEADQRHAELIVKDVVGDNSKALPVVTPGIKAKIPEEQVDAELPPD